MQSRFEFLKARFPKLAGYGRKSEEYLSLDSNICLLNLGRMSETIIEFLCNYSVIQAQGRPAHELLHELQEREVIDGDISAKLNTLLEVRDETLSGGYTSEATCRRLIITASELCLWFMDEYGVSRFEFLADLFPKDSAVPPLADLAVFGRDAEENLYSNTRYCLICLGDIGESIVDMLLNMNSINMRGRDQDKKIEMLLHRKITNEEINEVLDELRRFRNRAVHSRYEGLADGRRLLEKTLPLCEWVFMYLASPGDIVRGRVASFNENDISVNIGDISGTVNKSEVCDDDCETLRHVFTEGGKFTFSVASVNDDVLALSVTHEDPWKALARRYARKYEIGQVVNVRVSRLTESFGTFVRLRDGFEGRIPDNELGNQSFDMGLRLGQEFRAKITWFDPANYPYMLLTLKDVDEANDEVLTFEDESEDIIMTPPEEKPGETQAMPDAYFMEFCKTASAPEVIDAISDGANVHARNNNHMTPLMTAAMKNPDVGAITALLNSGANLEAHNDKGNTALIFASISNTPEVVRLLVSRGADITHTNNEGRDAAFYAALNRKLDEDEELLQILRCEEPDAMPMEDTQALACENGPSDEEETEPADDTGPEPTQTLSLERGPSGETGTTPATQALTAEYGYSDEAGTNPTTCTDIEQTQAPALEHTPFLEMDTTPTTDTDSEPAQPHTPEHIPSLEPDTSTMTQRDQESTQPPTPEHALAIETGTEPKAEPDNEQAQAPSLENGPSTEADTEPTIQQGNEQTQPPAPKPTPSHEPDAIPADDTGPELTQTLSLERGPSGETGTTPATQALTAEYGYSDEAGTNPTTCTDTEQTQAPAPEHTPFLEPDPTPVPDTSHEPTPASPITQEDFYELCKSGSTADILAAINSGADPNAHNKNGSNALMIASNSNTPEVISELISHTQDINTKNKKGNTALIIAAGSNNSDAVRTLLEAEGIDINAQNKAGRTALLCAVMNNTPEVVKAILEAGADPDIRDNMNISPYDFAMNRTVMKHNGIPELLMPPSEPERVPEVITPAPATETPAPNHESDEIVKMTMQKDFLKICREGTDEEVNDALNAGVKVNVMSRSGITGLMFAARSNTAGVVEALVKSGIVLDFQDIKGNTALIFAAAYNTDDVVDVLLDSGADPSIRNEAGHSALDYARLNYRLADTQALRRLEELTHN